MITYLRITVLALVCCILTHYASAQTGEVRGFVSDNRTGEAILFAPVKVREAAKGAQTDLNGYFAIGRIKAGTYTIVVKAVGYDSIEVPVTVVAGEIVTKKIKMKEATTTTDEVEIVGNKSKEVRKTTVNLSVSRLTPQDIKRLPGVGGESDLAQYLQVIPGVIFTGDQGGQLYMRGGTPVQTLTMLDGMIVYNPFHSIGLYSVFETDIIKNADVYTAAFGADYGGRASSVIDVRTLDGNQNRWSGQLGANPFTARAMVSGPLFKTADGTVGTFIGSARSSYLDKVAPQLYGRQLPFQFTDIFGKATISTANGSKFSTQGFNFTDVAKLGQESNFTWSSRGLGASFLLLPSKSSVLISGNLGFSTYSIGVNEAASTPRSSEISSLNGGLDFTYFIGKDELKYGLGVINNTTRFNTVSPNGLAFDPGQKSNVEAYLFGKYKWTIGNLILDPSVRINYYAILSQPTIEPRMGAKYNLSEKLRLKAGYGYYTQNLISTQSDRDIVNLFTGYFTSPENVSTKANSNEKAPTNIQIAQHFVGGIEYDITDEIEITIEPYTKTWSQFININRDAVAGDDPLFISESGIAQGIDLLAKYDYKSVHLQAGYSYGIVTRTFDGSTYFPVYDRRHNLNLLGGYSFGHRKSWEVDVRWNLGSGFPFTQTIGFYEAGNLGNVTQDDLDKLNGAMAIFYGGQDNFNRGRLPFYHRLDISVKKKFHLDEDTNLEVAAGITNGYNRNNLFYINRVTQERINQLPLLYTLGVNFQF